MSWKETSKVGFSADWTDPGPAPAVWDAERLVKVDVADVRAVVARPGNAHLSVQIGAIEINLAAKLVHHLADFPNSLLKDAVGRWVRHHQRGQPICMQLCFGTEIRKIDIAALTTSDNYNLHAR